MFRPPENELKESGDRHIKQSANPVDGQYQSTASQPNNQASKHLFTNLPSLRLAVLAKHHHSILFALPHHHAIHAREDRRSGSSVLHCGMSQSHVVGHLQYADQSRPKPSLSMFAEQMRPISGMICSTTPAACTLQPITSIRVRT